MKPLKEVRYICKIKFQKNQRNTNISGYSAWISKRFQQESLWGQAGSFEYHTSNDIKQICDDLFMMEKDLLILTFIDFEEKMDDFVFTTGKCLGGM